MVVFLSVEIKLCNWKNFIEWFFSCFTSFSGFIFFLYTFL